MKPGKNLIIYDGECGLCNRFVRFVLRFDQKELFLFSAYQSDYARNLLQLYQINAPVANTVYLYACSTLFTKSRAVIKIVSAMGGFWNISKVFYIFPKSMLDLFYTVLAKNRYRFFGRRSSCEIMGAEYKDRFLS